MFAKRITATNVDNYTSIKESQQIMVRARLDHAIYAMHHGEIGMVCYNPLDLAAMEWTIVFQRGRTSSDYPSLELLLRNEIQRGEFEFFHIEIL
jgi:hypothetical protein